MKNKWIINGMKDAKFLVRLWMLWCAVSKSTFRLESVSELIEMPLVYRSTLLKLCDWDFRRGKEDALLTKIQQATKTRNVSPEFSVETISSSPRRKTPSQNFNRVDERIMLKATRQKLSKQLLQIVARKKCYSKGRLIYLIRANNSAAYLHSCQMKTVLCR